MTGRPSIPVPPAEDLRAAYAEEGSLARVARRYDVDPGTAAKWFTEYGIEYADQPTASRRVLSKPTASFVTINDYPAWTAGQSIVYVHDLIAIDAGVDPHALRGEGDPPTVEVRFNEYPPAVTAAFALDIREMPWLNRGGRRGGDGPRSGGDARMQPGNGQRVARRIRARAAVHAGGGVDRR